MRKLPPLAAVRVFEAAARHGNFTRAAEELGMTQAAVSYQIKLLEERLGTPLFRREKRGVLLTEAGAQAAPQVSRGFDAIEQAFARLRAEEDGVLVISTSNTFADAWLAWRLGSFQMAHPDMAVRVETSDALADLQSGAVDCAIRAGLGDWPGIASEVLLPIDFTPMASPDFLARHGLELPADLLRLPRLSPDDDWWTTWLGEAGVPLPGVPVRGGVRLDSQAHDGRAAIAGQGVAILTPFFWRAELAEGRLVRPFGLAATRGYAYWFVVSEARRNVPKIKRFREWLRAEIGRDRPTPV
jgi:LysR family transcriptional regulator, glycine cleavage system transcriptional activator